MTLNRDSCLVKAGHGESGGSYEYLVFRSTLVGAARRHGLVPITDYQDSELEKFFQEVQDLPGLS